MSTPLRWTTSSPASRGEGLLTLLLLLLSVQFTNYNISVYSKVCSLLGLLVIKPQRRHSLRQNSRLSDPIPRYLLDNVLEVQMVF